MTTLTETSEIMSLSLLDAMTALWNKETINMVCDAMRRTLESVPDVSIIGIAFSLEADEYRCLHVVLDVETDAGRKRLAFYRRAPGLSFTKGTWIPKRLLAVRVQIDEHWIAPESPIQPSYNEPARYREQAMANISLLLALANRWKSEQLTVVYRAIERAFPDRAVIFDSPVRVDKHMHVTLKVFESNGWRRVFRYSPELSAIEHTWERCASTEPDRAQPEPTFDPATVNVRIPIKLFFA